MAYPSEVGIFLIWEGFVVTLFVLLLGWAGSNSDSVARFRDPPAPASVLVGPEQNMENVPNYASADCPVNAASITVQNMPTTNAYLSA